MKNDHNKEYYHARKELEGIPKVCVNCGNTEGVEMHHIVPLSMGGSNQKGNLVYLCRECHYKAHGANIGRYSGEREGRPKKEPPKGYERVVEKYILGKISWSDVRKLLKLGEKTKARECWWVQDYAERMGIERYEKYTIPAKTKKKAVTSKVWYTDGRITETWRVVKDGKPTYEISVNTLG